jgi:hypothetical protein
MLHTILAGAPVIERVAELDRDSLETVLASSARHLVTPALWPMLESARRALPADIAEGLEAANHLNRRRNAGLLEQIGEITTVTADIGIRPVFLKGAGLLLLRLHDDPGTRLVGDIDVLVRPEEVEGTAQALIRAGYVRLPDRVAYAHDPIRLARSGRPGLIDLHQAPLAFAILPVLPTEEVMARAVATETGELVPCAADIAAHSIAHAMLQNHCLRLSDLPLRDALDLARIARKWEDSIDWQSVEARLAHAPDGRAAFAFAVGATRAALRETALPEGGADATSRITRWRARAGRPPSRATAARVFMSAYVRDCAWRLRNLPGERQRMVRRVMSPRHYPDLLRGLLTTAMAGPPESRRGYESSRP